MRHVMGWLAVVVSLVACAACQTKGPDETTDGGSNGIVDGGTRDSGVADAGVGDGGAQDAGKSDGGNVETCGNAPGQLFPPASIWNTRVDSASTKLDGESSKVIAYLQDNHTVPERFQIDFSIKLLRADALTPRVVFSPTDDFFDPDCDPARIPMPAGGSIEDESGYACPGEGDCHLLVVDSSTCRLHEMWRANLVAGDYQGGCQVIWDLKKVYPPELRGAGCTSADAAGLPISAHLFSADEIRAGAIEHAIRFILPNEHIRESTYVHPATHSTSPPYGASGGLDAPPYGARLRLKASTNLGQLNSAAKVVARALMKYGMILSDGGNITFTAMADDFTTAKWSGVNLGSQDLKPLQWSDFEMVDGGERHDWHDDECSHQPITL